jgi:hypothetical protein
MLKAVAAEERNTSERLHIVPQINNQRVDFDEICTQSLTHATCMLLSCMALLFAVFISMTSIIEATD